MKIADYIKNQLPKQSTWINLILLKCNIFGAWAYGRSYRRFLKHIDEGDPEKKLLEMVNYAIRHVPYYRKRYGHLTIKNMDDFQRKIGFIDKTEVMEHWEELLADDIDWSNCIEGTTGGTSGKPLRLVLPQNRYIMELAFIHRLWAESGWKYHTRGVIRNHQLKGKNYVINPVTKEIIFDAFKISDNYVRSIVEILKRHNVHYIHSYPSAAYQFCKICDKNNIDIRFIHSFLCGSEEITDEQKTFFNKQGINICSWYGHSEKLILAGYDKKQDGYVVEKQYGYMELVNKKKKRIESCDIWGEMVGTTFYNKQMPLIRYCTGDFAQLKTHSQKGYVLNKIQGRWKDSLIYKKDGTTTSLTALNLHGDFYNHIDGMQYIQEKEGELIVLIIKGKQYSPQDETFIKTHIGNAMGEADAVKIKYVNKLIFLPNGKFLPLISINKQKQFIWNNLPKN